MAMNLVEKVAADMAGSDFWRDMSENMKENATHQREQITEMQAKGHAVSHLWHCFALWIPRLEKTDPRTAREMRDVRKKLEGLLHG